MNKKPTILAVDDTPENLDVLVRLLSPNYNVKVATNGARALQLACGSELPDLILLDIMMPEMDGFEVCRRLKEDQRIREVPVIFISALDEADDKVKAFAAGGVDYVTKPFQPAEVDARVSTHLELCRMRKELQDQNAHLDELVRQKSRELAEAHDRLAIVNDTKNEFLNLISHELRTPANGILGIADIVFDSCAGNKDAEELLPLYNQSRERMLSTLDDALLLARIHVSNEDFHPLPVSLGMLLAGACEGVKTFAADAGVSLLPPAVTDVHVAGDNKLFRMALTSLLKTSVALTGRGEAVRICLAAENDTVEICLTGKGNELEPQMLAGFLDVFSSVRACTPAESLGLKPAVAARIISLYGGKVAIQNTGEPGLELKIQFKKF